MPPDIDGFADVAPSFAEASQRWAAGATFADVVTAVEQLGGRAGRAAIDLYRMWIESHPGAPLLFAAWFNLGAEAGRIGDRDTAITAYRNASILRPDFHGAVLNLGVQLELAGQTEAALQAWGGALQPDEARVSLLNQRGRLFEQGGKLADAERELFRSLQTTPDQPDAIQHWVHLRQRMCLWPLLPEGMRDLPASMLERNCGPLAMLALTDDVDLQRDLNAAWIARKTTPAPERLAPARVYGHDRIRIGYLSSDFCRHAMSFLIAELFERHDRSRFEVYGYCLSPEDGSDIRARIIGAFDHFARVKELSDEQAARRIRADEIDVLVDLNGLTSGVRPQIIRYKPAPIQATYLGYIGPVPLPELDAVFCDAVTIPPETAAAYLPRPCYVGPNYQANDSKRAIGAPTTRAAAGLPEDRFVFCCFSNHYKVTEPMFEAWLAILGQAENAVLWLASDNQWSRGNLRARAAARGIDPDRLLFAERVGPADYIVRLGLADLFLDTFPYNAGTIASDAIRMRVPLVTLAGRSFASRMAASLLHAIGADAGVTGSFDEYVGLAVRLATDRDAYRAYKALYESDAWSRTIGDIAGFTRHYEAAVAELVRRSAAG